MKPKIDLSQKYAPLFTGDWRYAIVRGGRSSGKSHAVNAWAVMLTFEKGHKILHTRYTAASTKDSIVADVKSRIEEMELLEYFTITRDRIINKQTGSEIMFKGLKSSSNEEKARLKSISGVTTLIIEEAEDLRNEDDFNVIDLSIRGSATQKRLRTVFLLNPTDVEHFIYKRWFASEWYQNPDDNYSGQIKDTLYVLSHWKDVQSHLPAPVINELMRLKKERPEYYNYAIDGAWMHRREGTIYNNWTEREYRKTDNSIIGLDFGFDHPMSMVEVSLDNERKIAWVKELFYERHKTLDDLYDFIKNNKLMDRKFVGDSSRPEMIQGLKQKSDNIIQISSSKKGAGSVLDGIHLVQDYQIFVDPKSHNLLRELKMYVWDDKQVEKPVKEWDDALDALRYAIMTLSTKRIITYIEL